MAHSSTHTSPPQPPTPHEGTTAAARKRLIELLEQERDASVAQRTASHLPAPRVGENPSFFSSVRWGMQHAYQHYPEWRRALALLPWWPSKESPWHEVAWYSAAALGASIVLALVLWWTLPAEWLAITALILTVVSWVRLVWMHRPPKRRTQE